MPVVWSDEETLEVLDMTERLGLSASKVAAHFQETKKTKISRSAILGLLFRVRRDVDASDPTHHLNGTLGPRWWERDV